MGITTTQPHRVFLSLTGAPAHSDSLPEEEPSALCFNSLSASTHFLPRTHTYSKGECSKYITHDLTLHSEVPCLKPTWGCLQLMGKAPHGGESTFTENNIDSPIRVPLSTKQLADTYILQPLLEERVFHFSKAKIAALKAKANAEMGTGTISSLQALLAHLWVSVVRCQPISSDQEVKYIFLISARGRLTKPPLPDGYFGSTIHTTAIATTAGELLEKGVAWAALEMNKAIALQTSDQVWNFWKSWLENPKLIKRGVLTKNALATSSSPRFNVYGNDFGWGKPVAVRSGGANKSDGKITLFPGAEEGSIDIEVCLSPEKLVAMGEDKEFMEAVTI